MARQAGAFLITGCIDNLCFYKMEGKYYVRMKSSLRGKRVKKDLAFKRTMEYASLHANASKIASALYRELPKEEKGIAVYRMLTGKVMKFLQDGKSNDEILYLLRCKEKETTKEQCSRTKERILFNAYSYYADALIAIVFADIPIDEITTIRVMEEVPP